MYVCVYVGMYSFAVARFQLDATKAIDLGSYICMYMYMNIYIYIYIHISLFLHCFRTLKRSWMLPRLSL